jgi:hypothetical protein
MVFASATLWRALDDAPKTMVGEVGLEPTKA